MRNLLPLLSFITALLNYTTGYACYCGLDNMTLEQKTEKAAFIAHIKITDKEVVVISDEIKSKTNTPLFSEGRIKFNIIEHFKGPSISAIIEHGVNTSCDMGIAVGEEWIFFGYYDSTVKRYSVMACTPSLRYRNKEGEAEDQWSNRKDFINTLQKLFGRQLPVYNQGKHTTYYPSGKIESETYVEKDSLHGNRKVYYANGVLMKDENYNNGKLDGIQLFYARHGQLICLQEYKGNHTTYSVYWQDTSFTERKSASLFYNLTNNKDTIVSARLQKRLESWYDTTTGNRHSVIFNVFGIKEREFYTFNKGAEQLSCEYDDTGSLKYESYSISNAEITTDKRWNEKGQVISDKRWEKGKLVKSEK